MITVNPVLERLQAKYNAAPELAERVAKLFSLADLATELKCKLVFKTEAGALKYSEKFDQFSIWSGDFPNSTLAYTLTRKGVESKGAKAEVTKLITLINQSEKSGKELLAEIGTICGSCCFCGKELTTEESRTAGYGPICAGKYELPWGQKNELGNVGKKQAKKKIVVEKNEAQKPGDVILAAFYN